ncbi:MAG: TolC family protein [Cyanobacteriota bacterium]
MEFKDLAAPLPLALPNQPSQVRIRQLRPLGLVEVETIAEVNNPELKSLGTQVLQAQSRLRAEISRWYPQINLNISSFPAYTAGERFSSVPSQQNNSVTTEQNTFSSFAGFQASLQASWALIDPSRNPTIAAARDEYEKAKNGYLIGLRELRLQASQAYFDLQYSDDQVRIGQESVRSSLVSLRDARARFQAGVATKLEVLEAETQLARDQQLLTSNLAQQSVARRLVASILDLPQDVTPTAKEPARVVGVWLPSLQESIVAAYAFREELDQLLLDISISNSSANVQLAAVQPLLKIFNSFSTGRASGYNNSLISDPPPGQYSWNVDNSFGMNLTWNFFDGGRARALYREQKQRADQNRFQFARQRDAIRQEVETSFYELLKNNRNIATTAREVLSSRESLRLARLRFQAGVTTQREVVDTQRDLTTAEVRHALAISDYNKRLADMRRRTGLDQIAICQSPSLPSTKPRVEGASDVPVEPLPLLPACSAQSAAHLIPPKAPTRQ